MIGEIHLEGEVLERFLDDQLAREEERAILKHLGNGNCERCEDALANVDGWRFNRVIGKRLKRARVYLRVFHRHLVGLPRD